MPLAGAPVAQAPGNPRTAGPGPGGLLPAAPEAGDGDGGGKISRRMVGRALGAVAAGAVGAGALAEMAQPAAADSGSAVLAGDVTTSEARTAVLYDGSPGIPGVVLLGNDSIYT